MAPNSLSAWLFLSFETSQRDIGPDTSGPYRSICVHNHSGEFNDPHYVVILYPASTPKEFEEFIGTRKNGNTPVRVFFHSSKKKQVQQVISRVLKCSLEPSAKSGVRDISEAEDRWKGIIIDSSLPKLTKEEVKNIALYKIAEVNTKSTEKDLISYPDLIEYLKQMHNGTGVRNQAFDEWCNFGLDLLDNLGGTDIVHLLRVHLLRAVADRYFDYGYYGMARYHYVELINSNDLPLADVEMIAEIYASTANAYILEGETPEEAQKYTALGEKILEDNNIPLGPAYFMLEINGIKSSDRNKTTKIVQYTTGIGFARHLPKTNYLVTGLALAYKWLGTDLLDMGRYSEAQQAYAMGVKFAREVDNKDLVAQCLLNEADLASETWDSDHGLALALEGKQVSEESNELDNIAYAKALEGNIYITLGDYEKAIRILLEAIESSIELKSYWNMAFMYSDLAIAYLESGKIVLAEEAIRQAQDKAFTKELSRHGYVFLALGRINASQQRTEAYRENFTTAIRDFQRDNHLHFLARAQYHFAKAITSDPSLKDDKEAVAGAIDLLKSSVNTLTELGLHKEAEVASDWLRSINP